MYTFTEAIAIIFSLSVLIKFSIFFLGNTPTKILISNTKKVYENKMLRALYFLLFFVTFYLVSTELSIIQIVAGITVGLFLYGHMLMHFPKEMTKIAAKFPNIVNDTRGLGLIQGLVINNAYTDAKTITLKAFDKGLLLVPAGGNVVRFVPPLIITKNEINILLKKLDLIFEEL